MLCDIHPDYFNQACNFLSKSGSMTNCPFELSCRRQVLYRPSMTRFGTSHMKISNSAHLKGLGPRCRKLADARGLNSTQNLCMSQGAFYFDINLNIYIVTITGRRLLQIPSARTFIKLSKIPMNIFKIIYFAK